MSETSNVRYRITCPHLGMLQDKFTAFSYPTEGNYCFKCKVPTSPPLSHQDEYCLTLKPNDARLSRKIDPTHSPRRSSTRIKGLRSRPEKKRFLWISLGLLATVMVSYAVSMYLHNGQIELPYLNIRAKQNNTPLAVETGGEHMIPSHQQCFYETATVIPNQRHDPVNESALITQTDRPTHVKTTAKPSLANVLNRYNYKCSKRRDHFIHCTKDSYGYANNDQHPNENEYAKADKYQISDDNPDTSCKSTGY